MTTMRAALKNHWPEYLIEAWGLGVFMISAGLFDTLLEHPASPIHQALPSPVVRRLLMGVAMGATAAALVYSPWGKRSGAHFNPAFTLSFLRLRKVAPWDALFYVIAQFVGGFAGLELLAVAEGKWLSQPRVDYVVTIPGAHGAWGAFWAELVISAVLMFIVLLFVNSEKWHTYTGLVVAGLLVAYITIEAPWSGMSINPARTFASALCASLWTSIWVYFTAPVIGMLIAVEAYGLTHGHHRVLCAKLHHKNDKRCIFPDCKHPNGSKDPANA